MSASNATPQDLWTKEAANAWYGKLPYLKGSNFLPAYAINQLEMWQADSFDAKRIDEELGWAEAIGMNTMRVLQTNAIQSGYGGSGNTFETILPLARKFNVAAINWGFVAGKSQTYMPWDSWLKPYINGREPAVWFHDIFHADGRPYRPAEIQVLKNI